MHNFLFIKQDGFQIKIVISAILYIQADGKYISIFTSSNKYLTRLSIQSFLQLVNKEEVYFCQVHKSYAVQLATIKGFDRSSIIVQDKKIPIGRRFKKQLMIHLKGQEVVNKEKVSLVAPLYPFNGTVSFNISRMNGTLE